MMPRPALTPAAMGGESHCPGPERRRIKAPTSIITCRMAPAPTPKHTAIHKGLTACVPRTVPTIAGNPASAARPANCMNFGLSSAIGTAMPMPSVTLWMVKPMTRKVASAAEPVARAAPTASPSPRLCRPMPNAMKVASRKPSGATPLARPMASRTSVVTASITQNSTVPRKRPMVSAASSSPSPMVSINRKASRPTVSASKKFIVGRDSERMAGQARSPVATGTAPSRSPTAAKSPRDAPDRTGVAVATSIVWSIMAPVAVSKAM